MEHNGHHNNHDGIDGNSSVGSGGGGGGGRLPPVAAANLMNPPSRGGGVGEGGADIVGVVGSDASSSSLSSNQFPRPPLPVLPSAYAAASSQVRPAASDNRFHDDNYYNNSNNNNNHDDPSRRNQRPPSHYFLGSSRHQVTGATTTALAPPQHYHHHVPQPQQPRQCLTWTRLPIPSHGGHAPPPRSGAASVVVQGRLYIFGGYGGGTGRLDDFYSYHFATGVWEQVAVRSTAKPGCRENNGVVISDSCRKIYLFGGYNGSSWLNDLWEFDIESHIWTCIQEVSDPPPAPVPVPPLAAAAAVEPLRVEGGPEVAVGGGHVVPHRPHQVQGYAPSRRFGYVSVVHQGKFVLWGGFDGSRWLNDMHVFDFATRTWTEIHTRGALPSVRSCPSWAKDDTHVYIQGGYDGVERKADFFACDLETYTWTEMPCLGTPPSPRYFHSCCLYGPKMYLYGGYSGSERLADMHVYDFETNHWSQVDCTGGDAPSGRSSLVAQVYENLLWVFGGYNGQTVLNDFYRFRLKPIGVPPPALVHDFGKLINNPDLADVRFVVEGHDAFAHRAVLAVRSEYFRVMLYTGGMRESQSHLNYSHNRHPDAAMAAASSSVATTATTVGTQHPSPAGGMPSGDPAGLDDDHHMHTTTDSDPAHHEGSLAVPIEILDVSYTVFVKVLEYLYTDTVRDVTLETAIHLMMASEQFMLDRLKALCEDLIRRDIHVENVVSILVASHRHNATGLKDIALEYILRNLNDPVVMSGLADLKADPDLLLEIIKRSTEQSSSQVIQGSPPASSLYGRGNNNNNNSNNNNNNAGAAAGRDEYAGPFGGGGVDWRR